MFFSKIFTYGLFLSKNGKVPENKIFDGIFFEIYFFWVKICFEIFWIDSKKKKFRKFFFENFHFLTPFVKKWLSPRKNNFKGNFFRNQLFRFKIRFETFWIDLKKKNFSKFFFSKMFIFDHFWPFLVIFDHFWPFFEKISEPIFWPKMLFNLF